MGAFDTSHLDHSIAGYLRRDFTPLRIGQSVEEALSLIRSQRVGERLVYFYVADAGGRLAGVIPTRRLLAADAHVRVESIMVPDLVKLPASATVRDACEAFLRHRFLAFPVVDEHGRLQGIVDAGLFTGEIADLTGRQSADDVFQLIGVHVAEAVRPFRSFTDRLPWLCFNVGGGLLAAALAALYEPLLEAAVVLVLFIPVVLALAESVSIQSVSITLQRLHAPARGRQRFLRALLREVATAMLLGLACGAGVGLVALAWQQSGEVAIALGTVICLSMMTACVLGVALPTALHALRRDPKVAAGPIVLALADVLTLLFYFNLSGLLLT